MADRDEKKASLVATTAAGPEAALTAVGEVLDIGHGSTLIVSANVNYNLTEEIQSITPEMASHQLALARIEADKQIKVAELTHLAPIKAMVRPLWVAILALGGLAGYALSLGKEYLPLAVVAVAGMAVAPLVDAIAKRIKKPTE